MVLLDQIPVSTLSEIEVTPGKMSNGELNKETVEVRWKFTLEPSQQVQLVRRCQQKDMNKIILNIRYYS